MTAPQRPAGLDANSRGILVIVVAVVVAGLLLWKAADGNEGSSVATTGPDTSTTIDTSGLGSTTLPVGTDTTPTTGDPTGTTAAGGGDTTTTAAEGTSRSDVNVIVLNGSGKTGVAKENSTTIGGGGFKMLEPTNAATSADTTTVYFAEGYEADATAVAGMLGTSNVKPKPEGALAGNGTDSQADVIVVLGKDIPPAAGG